MVVHSAAVLPFAIGSAGVSVFIAHMGGPFWSRKDDGAWSIAKGEFDPTDEEVESAARREFTEEIGVSIDGRTLEWLGEFKLPSGKRLHVHLLQDDQSLQFVGSNQFELEWPRGSGSMVTFPEVDRAEWFSVAEARNKLVKGQLPVLDELMTFASRVRPDVSEGSSRNSADETLF